jgi:hypothetical protein
MPFMLGERHFQVGLLNAFNRILQLYCHRFFFHDQLTSLLIFGFDSGGHVPPYLIKREEALLIKGIPPC